MTPRNNILLVVFLALVSVFAYAGTPITYQTQELAYTQTPLGASDTYTGPSVYIGDYGRIKLMVYADEDSDTDGVKIQQTGDKGCDQAGATPNWDYESVYSYTAEGNGAYSIETMGRCARIVYVNGTDAQTEFRLYGSLKTN